MPTAGLHAALASAYVCTGTHTITSMCMYITPMGEQICLKNVAEEIETQTDILFNSKRKEMLLAVSLAIWLVDYRSEPCIQDFLTDLGVLCLKTMKWNFINNALCAPLVVPSPQQSRQHRS